MSHFNQTIKKQKYKLRKSVFDINVTPSFIKYFFIFFIPSKIIFHAKKNNENYLLEKELIILTIKINLKNTVEKQV